MNASVFMDQLQPHCHILPFEALHGGQVDGDILEGNAQTGYECECSPDIHIAGGIEKKRESSI